MKPAGPLVAALWAAAVPMLVAAGGAVVLGACTSCQSTVRQSAMPVVATGTFDGVVADPASRQLYLADGANNNVDVVDISTATPQFVRALDVTTAPHGLAIASDTHLLYVALTGGEVAVIDTQYGSPRYLQVVTRIVADTPEVDLLDYSAQTKRLFASTGPGRGVIAIDTTTNKMIRRYALGVPTEQPRYNPVDGLLYVSSPRRRPSSSSIRSRALPLATTSSRAAVPPASPSTPPNSLRSRRAVAAPDFSTCRQGRTRSREQSQPPTSSRTIWRPTGSLSPRRTATRTSWSACSKGAGRSSGPCLRRRTLTPRRSIRHTVWSTPWARRAS